MAFFLKNRKKGEILETLEKPSDVEEQFKFDEKTKIGSDVKGTDNSGLINAISPIKPYMASPKCMDINSFGEETQEIFANMDPSNNPIFDYKNFGGSNGRRLDFTDEDLGAQNRLPQSQFGKNLTIEMKGFMDDVSGETKKLDVRGSGIQFHSNLKNLEDFPPNAQKLRPNTEKLPKLAPEVATVDQNFEFQTAPSLTKKFELILDMEYNWEKKNNGLIVQNLRTPSAPNKKGFSAPFAMKDGLI